MSGTIQARDLFIRLRYHAELHDDCAPHDEEQVEFAKELRVAADVVEAVLKVHAAKGRYHSQIATCDLFDLVGLPNVRPVKETP